MQIQLTPEEKEELELRHHQEIDRKTGDRIKSILLRDEGWSFRKIAQALRLHNDTVSRYINDYINSKKLSTNHKGSLENLSSEQASELSVHLNNNLYTKASDIAAYVKETYSIEYTISGMTAWLKRNKFSYRNPKGQPSKADPEKQKEFIKEYENLKAEIPKNEPILFMDAVHPTMASKTTRAWIKTGIEKFLSTTAFRTCMNIVGTIELSAMKVVSNFMIQLMRIQ